MSEQRNDYIHTARSVDIGNPSWTLAQKSGLTDLSVKHTQQRRMQDQNGHSFMNMCSCSYLGLEVDQRLARRAAHFRCRAFTATSCSAGIVASLPLLAAGMFTDGQRPVLIFDKHAHFALNQVKAICGDEAQVVTCNHNDIDFIEDMCKRHPLVADVADGAYGERGEGYIRTYMPELNSRTLLVYSLAKAFGANGGGIFMSEKADYHSIFRRFGGPMSYSQYINPAAIGAAMASLDIHKSRELGVLQEKLSSNIQLFDSLFKTVTVSACSTICCV